MDIEGRMLEQLETKEQHIHNRVRVPAYKEAASVLGKYGQLFRVELTSSLSLAEA